MQTVTFVDLGLVSSEELDQDGNDSVANLLVLVTADVEQEVQIVELSVGPAHQLAGYVDGKSRRFRQLAQRTQLSHAVFRNQRTLQIQPAE